MSRLLLWVTAAIVGLGMLTSCDITDPLGATTRQDIRSASAVRIAEVQAQAQIESAHAAAQARVATARTWTEMLPLLLVILVGGALAGLILYFRGRAYLVSVERGTHPSPTLISPAHRRKLADYARQTGQQLEQVDGQYYLVDQHSGRRVKALPKP